MQRARWWEASCASLQVDQKTIWRNKRKWNVILDVNGKVFFKGLFCQKSIIYSVHGCIVWGRLYLCYPDTIAVFQNHSTNTWYTGDDMSRTEFYNCPVEHHFPLCEIDLLWHITASCLPISDGDIMWYSLFSCAMHQDIKPNDASKVDHQYHQISDLWTVLPSSSSPSPSPSSSSSSSFIIIIIIIIILKESIDPLVSFSNQSYPSNMVEKKKGHSPISLHHFGPRLAGGWIIFATFTIWSWSLIGLYMLLSGLMTLAARFRFQGARRLRRGSNRLFAHTHMFISYIMILNGRWYLSWNKHIGIIWNIYIYTIIYTIIYTDIYIYRIGLFLLKWTAHETNTPPRCRLGHPFW